MTYVVAKNENHLIMGGAGLRASKLFECWPLNKFLWVLDWHNQSKGLKLGWESILGECLLIV